MFVILNDNDGSKLDLNDIKYLYINKMVTLQAYYIEIEMKDKKMEKYNYGKRINECRKDKRSSA